MKRKTNNVVSSVYPDSIAEEMEIEVGDLLLTINGKEVIDIIDYLFLVVDDFGSGNSKIRWRSVGFRN